jgi:hypothetical protein
MVGSLKKRDYLGDPGADGRITIKCIRETVWTCELDSNGSVQDPIARLYEHAYETSDAIRHPSISPALYREVTAAFWFTRVDNLMKSNFLKSVYQGMRQFCLQFKQMRCKTTCPSSKRDHTIPDSAFSYPCISSCHESGNSQFTIFVFFTEFRPSAPLCVCSQSKGESRLGNERSEAKNE